MSEVKVGWKATYMVARHLRREHGWGIRRIALELEVPEGWVKDMAGDVERNGDQA